MRRRLPALVGMSLLLAGCSAEQPVPSTDQSTDETPAAEPAADIAALPFGQWAPADCPVDQPCDVEFRITDIALADTCEFGRKPDAGPLAENTMILTLYTEARSGLTADGEAHLFSTPEVIDSNGRVQPATYDQPCADNPDHAGFEYLLTGIEENSETRFADMFAVPADSEALLFEGHRLELTATGAKAGSSTAGRAGSSESADNADSAGGVSIPDSTPVTAGNESAPHVVGACEADGQAMFSDGQRRAVANCATGDEGDSSTPNDVPYRCADTGEQVSDPSDCVAAPPVTPAPGPTPTTASPTPTLTHPNPGSFINDYEAGLWTDCANEVVTDKLLCSTMYDLYGQP